MLVHLNHAWHACPARISMTFPTFSLGPCGEPSAQGHPGKLSFWENKNRQLQVAHDRF
jgi:hypothetical protein